MTLQQAVSDILVMMDCPYWTPVTFKRCGVLEILAASTFEDFTGSAIPPGSFTNLLSTNLRVRAAQTYNGSPYVTDLHAHLATEYRHIIPETRYSEERIKNFPNPVHMLISERNTPRLSIQLAPRSQHKSHSRGATRSSDQGLAPPEHIRLQVYVENDQDRVALDEWLRIRPDKVEVNTEEHGLTVVGSSRRALEERGPPAGRP